MSAVHIQGDDFLCVIDDIFTKQECRDLIARAEKNGWHRPGTGGSYLRSIIIDKKLADDVFKRIKKHIPDKYVPHDGHPGFKLICINDHFRFSRYHIGGKFDPHCDGQNYDSGNRMSIMTLNIFLNDNFEGGETDFFNHDNGQLKLRYRVEPKPGRGALFYHNQWHRGNVVKEPYKYLIRTDVMGEMM